MADAIVKEPARPSIERLGRLFLLLSPVEAEACVRVKFVII